MTPPVEDTTVADRSAAGSPPERRTGYQDDGNTHARS